MIVSFAHKGLERFFKTKSLAGIQAKHADRLRLILTLLNSAKTISDINFPGSGLHQLKGDKLNLWAIKVSENWRITFKMEEGNVYIVNYIDYH